MNLNKFALIILLLSTLLNAGEKNYYISLSGSLGITEKDFTDDSKDDKSGAHGSFLLHFGEIEKSNTFASFALGYIQTYYSSKDNDTKLIGYVDFNLMNLNPFGPNFDTSNKTRLEPMNYGSIYPYIGLICGIIDSEAMIGINTGILLNITEKIDFNISYRQMLQDITDYDEEANDYTKMFSGLNLAIHYNFN